MESPERMKMVIDYEKVSARRFSKEVGTKSENVIYHVLRGRNEISPSLAKQVNERYPEINYVWLLTGHGNMLNADGDFVEDVKEPGKLISMKNVPVIPIHARAGYLNGYGDPEYIESMQTMNVEVDQTFHGKYRIFEVDGDSMDDGTSRGYVDGELVLCREIPRSNWMDAALHYKQWDFVIVSIEDGITIKEVISHDVANHTIVCHPLNSIYNDFTIHLSKVVEIYDVIRTVGRNRRR